MSIVGLCTFLLNTILENLYICVFIILLICAFVHLCICTLVLTCACLLVLVFTRKTLNSRHRWGCPWTPSSSTPPSLLITIPLCSPPATWIPLPSLKISINQSINHLFIICTFILCSFFLKINHLFILSKHKSFIHAFYRSLISLYMQTLHSLISSWKFVQSIIF